MEPINTYFDPNEPAPKRKIILVGTFPAHVVDIVEGKLWNGGIPYNYTYRIAPEAADIEGLNWVEYQEYCEESDDDQEYKDEQIDSFKEEAGEHDMPGRDIRAEGVWLTPNPKKGESWRNRRFIEHHQNLGLKFPEDKDGKIQLAKPKEEDVLGLPCMVRIGLVPETRKDENGNKYETGRRFPRVVEIAKWEDGKQLDLEEIVGDALADDEQEENKKAEEDLEKSGF